MSAQEFGRGIFEIMGRAAARCTVRETRSASPRVRSDPLPVNDYQYGAIPIVVIINTPYAGASSKAMCRTMCGWVGSCGLDGHAESLGAF